MRRRVFLIVFSCVLFVMSLVGFGAVRYERSAPVPVPSVPGGYYEDAFTLYLTAPSGGRIYYTTDGSTPTASSTPYRDGILLENRTDQPNVYNSIQNVVSDWKTYSPDLQLVEKGTVIRAIYVNRWGVQSDILTQTYFVGLQPPERGYTLSLIFEYDDLFGDDGIYVTGKAYDDWYLSESQSGDAPIPNFEKHQQKTATAEIMNQSGDILNQPIGLRLQGNSARGWYKKRFILKAESELSGSRTFSADIFQGISTHSVMTKDCIVDAVIHDLVSGRSISSQKSIPVRVFLNGEFFYDSYLLERYDKQYFREYFNVEEAMLVKDGVVDKDISIDKGAFYSLMDWVSRTDFSDDTQWEQLKAEVDVQSFIDYTTVNYYLCNWDFSDFKNHLLWRSTTLGKSPYADKRWRWCVYDVDALPLTLSHYALENAAQLNTFSCKPPYSDVKMEDTVFFHSFSSSPEFRQQFVLSFMDMVNNNFAPANVEKVLADYGYTLDWMDGFFRKRPAYAMQHLAEEFDLSGSPETVTVTAQNPEMGSVTVNTSRIDLSSGSWSGQYFTDYPITVTASANDGYEFLGWKGDAGGTEETITVSVDGGITLEAVFAKIK